MSFSLLSPLSNEFPNNTSESNNFSPWTTCFDVDSFHSNDQLPQFIEPVDFDFSPNILATCNSITKPLSINKTIQAKHIVTNNSKLQQVQRILLLSRNFIPRPHLPHVKSCPTMPNFEDRDFQDALKNSSLIVNPKQLGFIPEHVWGEKDLLLGNLITDFFQRKNNSNSRFSHKLFNALKLSDDNRFTKIIGIKWITNEIIQVDKLAFARLLGIKSVDGSLFHQQGNFPSHGFIEVSYQDAKKSCPNLDLKSIDFENIRLLTHSNKIFVKGCSEKDIEECKWANSRSKRF